MKKSIKVLIWICSFLVAFFIAAAIRFFMSNTTLKEYSTYCIDSVRSELWEYIGNIHMNEAYCSDWVCIYMWGVSYEWVDYGYSCKVFNKENVDLKLEPLNNKVDTDEVALTGGESQDNALIIVFSPTWNTKQIATYISEINGSELEELLPMTGYTEEDLNWRNEESRSFKEFKDSSIKPEIATEFDLEWYDTIYLWYPIWFGRTPNIITTFLDNYDLSGKNVILFCTSEHVWIEGSVEYLEPYKLNVIASKRFEQGSSKEQVKEWLESL